MGEGAHVSGEIVGKDMEYLVCSSCPSENVFVGWRCSLNVDLPKLVEVK